MYSEDRLKEMANKFQKEGYDVILHPEADDLPTFLANGDVLLLAHREGEYRTIESADTPAASGESVFAPKVLTMREPDIGYVERQLSQAESLIKTGSIDGALLVAWAATEAALRKVARWANEDIRTGKLQELVRIANRTAIIDSKEASHIQSCLRARNAVAHGFQTVSNDASQVSGLIEITKRIVSVLQGATDTTAPAIGLSVTLVSNSVKDEIGDLIDGVNELLWEITKRSSSPVQAEWQTAENGEGKTIIVLRLSDEFGAVTGTFSPGEFVDVPILREILKFRLKHLWGDLLQIRSHEQLKQLELSSEQQGA